MVNLNELVDDAEGNIDVLLATLGDEFDVRVAMDGPGALELLEEETVDLVLLDIVMPGMDGHEVFRKMKENPRTRNISVIFLSGLSEVEDEAHGLAMGAADYITKPFKPALLRARVHNQLELKLYRDHLEELVRERTAEIELVQHVTIESLACLAEYRDPETGMHIRRTQHYVRELALTLRLQPKYADVLDDTYIENLHRSAPLHDIGKVGVPDAILQKPGKLTAEEFEEMKKHTIYGHDTLAAAEKQLGSNSFLRVAREMAQTHHERWDGSGYPGGLAGETIPLCGRIMAVADVYDALTSKRRYKPSFTHEAALDILREGRDKHFDPDLLDAFLAISDSVEKIAQEYADMPESEDDD
jgi:putative two-component system response regulator